VAAPEPNQPLLTVPLGGGIALSNAGGLADGGPPRPLNGLVGSPAAQIFTVVVHKQALPGLATVRDVIFAVECTDA
jgi:hypothetical protein